MTAQEHAYKDIRRHLLNLAYRMLGDWHEAEDATQDVLARWVAQPIADVADPKAYMSRMVINRCRQTFRALKQARVQQYYGPWLPEPDWQPEPAEPGEAQPLSVGLMYLLEALSANERAVFVLRESYHMPFEQIAEVLDTSAVNCRQLLSRARAKLKKAAVPNRITEPEQHAEIAIRFLTALDKQNLAGLLEILAPGVVMISDGGGKATAARVPLVGSAKVAQFFYNVSGGKNRGRFTARIETVNGLPVACIVEMSTGLVVSMLAFELNAQGQVEQLYALRNPDKLSRLQP